MTVYNDKYGKTWKEINFSEVQLGDIVCFSIKNPEGGVDYDTGWTIHHYRTDYTHGVTDIDANNSTIYIKGYPYRIGDGIGILRLDRGVPYDPNQEPEEDCL